MQPYLPSSNRLSLVSLIPAALGLVLATGSCSKSNSVDASTNVTDPCAAVDAGPSAQACNGECVDLMSNPSHCGKCDSACAAGASCVSGECGCPGSEVICKGACTDLKSDLANCGQCGNACSSGATCVEGECRCPGAKGVLCGGKCVDLAADAQNCGQCGTACVEGASCQQGACGCAAAGSMLCSGKCIDTLADADNCGKCGQQCADDETCSAGKCVCPGQGAKLCGGKCVDVLHDEANCGDCGVGCPVACDEGKCAFVVDAALGAEHTCALLSGGGIRCWGRGDTGQLGDGGTQNRPRPQTVSLPGVQAADVAAGKNFSCAATSKGGGLWCWGAQQPLGACGATQAVNPPAMCGGTSLAMADRVVAGREHVCAWSSQGAFGGGPAWCFGANERGQSLVDPKTTLWVDAPQSAEMAGEMSAGAEFSCSISGMQQPGLGGCWGDNTGAQLGTSDPEVNLSFTSIPLHGDLAAATSISAGWRHACAIVPSFESGNQTHNVLCWGDNSMGQFGNAGAAGSAVPLPMMVDSGGQLTKLSDAVAIAAGSWVTCVLRKGLGADKQIWCAGTAEFLPKNFASGKAEAWLTDQDYAGFALGQGDFACAWNGSGMWCAGKNDSGQLGDGSSGAGVIAKTPVRVLF